MSNASDIAIQVQNNWESLRHFIPELILASGFLILSLTGLFKNLKTKLVSSILTLSTLVLSIYFQSTKLVSSSVDVSLFNQLFHHNFAINSLNLLILLSTLLGYIIFVLGKDSVKHNVWVLILFGSTLGAIMLASSSNFLSLMLGLEMLSIGSYVLVSFEKTNSKQSDGAMRYMFFGLAATAITWYGLSLLFGLTGEISWQTSDFLSNLSKHGNFVSSLAIVMVMGGILFKISAVPLHLWSPDAYESSSPATAFILSTLPKLAGFSLLMSFAGSFVYRLNDVLLLWPKFNWIYFLAMVSVLTMTLGNLSALFQKDYKRLMAFSSIAHSGYLLLAVLCFSVYGSNALLFYFLVYVVMNGLAFLGFQQVAHLSGSNELSSFKGFGKKWALLGVSLSIAMFALIGLPPTGGFTAKLQIFTSLINEFSHQESLFTMVIFALIINTVISVIYYIKVPYYLFFFNEEKSSNMAIGSWSTWITLALAILLILTGIFPSWFIIA